MAAYTHSISFWTCVFLAFDYTEGTLRTYHSIYFKDKITRKHVQVVSVWQAHFLFLFLANCKILDNLKESRHLSSLQMLVQSCLWKLFSVSIKYFQLWAQDSIA
jgi:hypothetical protein